MKDKELRKVVRALLNYLGLEETHDFILGGNYYGNIDFQIRAKKKK